MTGRPGPPAHAAPCGRWRSQEARISPRAESGRLIKSRRGERPSGHPPSRVMGSGQGGRAAKPRQSRPERARCAHDDGRRQRASPRARRPGGRVRPRPTRPVHAPRFPFSTKRGCLAGRDRRAAQRPERSVNFQNATRQRKTPPNRHGGVRWGSEEGPRHRQAREALANRRVPEAGPSARTMTPWEVSAMLESGIIAFVGAFAGVTIWRAVRKLIGRK